MSRVLRIGGWAAVFLISLLLVAGPAPAKGAAARRAEGPAGLRGEEAVRALGPRLTAVAQAYDRPAEELRRHLRADGHLYVDPADRLYYVEAVPTDADTLTAQPASGDPMPAAAPLSETFTLHSRPGSQRVIYLDFDGQLLSGTIWDQAYNDGIPIAAPAWDIEGGPTVFTDTERTRIQQMWQRVAEDYAPFAVDVTTEYPGEAAITRSSTADQSYGMRVLVSPISSYIAYAGGIAYIGVFDMVGDYYKPALVFPEMLSHGEKTIGEAAAHENGHTLGLLHDGILNGDDYYLGHGSGETGWAPIMGAGYYRNLTQWSKGEYAGADNQEDDLVTILANGLAYQADDHGNTSGTATVLSGGDPLTASGRIGQTGDADVFAFTVAAGTVDIDASTAPLGPNLDLLLELRNGAGTLVASSNPSDLLAAGLSQAVPAGTYYLTVKGTGKGDPATGYSAYASLGTYALEIDLPPTIPTPTVTAPNAGGSFTQGAVVPVSWTLSPTAGSGVMHLYAYDAAGTYHFLTTKPAVAGQSTYSYDWTVTQPPGTGYTVRVWYVDGAGNWLAFDGADAPFTIQAGSQPTPTVTAPNSGGTFTQGAVVPVSWTLAPTAGSGVMHLYAYDAAGTYHFLTTKPAVAGQSTYSYDWTVSQPAGTGYTVRVWYVDGAGNWLSFDGSDAPFTIQAGSQPTPTVTAPNSGGTFTQGAVVPVSWTLAPTAGSGVMHLYAYDAAGTYHFLTTKPAVAGQSTYSYDWTVSQPPGTGYTVRVWYVDGAGNWLGFDGSDAPFTIQAGSQPTPTVTAPNSGGTFTQGAVVPVSWTLAPTAGSGVMHLYAYDAAGTYHFLTTKPAVAGQSTYSYDWTVSQPAGTGYTVRVWYVDGGGNWLAFDGSDNPFSIVTDTP